jgi:hypothetical protein
VPVDEWHEFIITDHGWLTEVSSLAGERDCLPELWMGYWPSNASLLTAFMLSGARPISAWTPGPASVVSRDKLTGGRAGRPFR